MHCEYCNNTFKNMFTLKTHQTKTKYCLKLQGKTSQKGDYICEYCSKDFTLKASLEDHYNSCKANTKFVRLYRDKCSDLEKKLDTTIIQLQDALRREQELREDYAKLATISAKKATTTTTNTTVNTLNLGVFDKSQDDIKRIVDENYDRTYLIQGQKGVAKFTHKHVLVSEDGKLPIYVITDRSRGNGKYKISDTEVVTDAGMAGLTKKMHPSIKSKAIYITSTAPNPLEDEELMAGYHAVFDMDQDNTIFRNSLVQELNIVTNSSV